MISPEALFITALTLVLLEFFIPAFGMLSFGGFAAFSIGAMMLILSDADHFYGLDTEVVIAIGLLIFITFAVFFYYVARQMRVKTTTGTEAMIGETVTVTRWDGSEGSILFEGEDWRAQSDAPLKKDDRVKIISIDKNTVTVKKESKE